MLPPDPPPTRLETFAQHHPFEVVDKTTGEVVARFSNYRAALATARDMARFSTQGIDVVHEGLVMDHLGGRRPPEFDDQTTG